MWENWGRLLFSLHTNFQNAQPYSLKRNDVISKRQKLKPLLIPRKKLGIIEIDSSTTLSGIPNEVWNYCLGTYSAVEWVLERYKEKSPKDETIRTQFNAYNLANYKEEIIDLIMRVCTVSVETMKIISEMPDY